MSGIFGITRIKMEEPPITNGSMSSYKDISSVSVLDIYQGGVLFIQDYIYKHICNSKVINLEDLHKYVSYEDMASLLTLNRTYGYNTNNRLINLYNKFPYQYRNNVDTICTMLANNKKEQAISQALNLEPTVIDHNHSGDWWNVEVIGTDIIVIIREGSEKLLYDRKKKLDLLKKLCERSFNVLGESNTYQQPYFRDLIVSV